jgi:hypothetical protein
LAYRPDRDQNARAVLVPGGRAGVWITGSLGLLICLFAMALSMIPPGETSNKAIFEMKLLGGTGIAIAIGLLLYWRAKRQKR